MTGFPLWLFGAAVQQPIFRARRKGSAMNNLLKSFFVVQPSRQERERAYLEEAVSRIDLERRQRDVERGLFREPHPYF
jgi:hypothetical protein